MNHSQHIKTHIHHYHHEIFRDCSKMESLSTNTYATWYIILSGQQAAAQLYKKQKNKYICTAFTNVQQKCCYFAIQGQFYHHYIASRLQKNHDLIITEQEIIVLITSICQAFAYLRQFQCSHKLTNFKQYSIVKLYNCTGYKLLYHQSMISQFDIAKNNDINWYELYLSPEQLNGQFVQQKSVVFSFGVMLLNLCTLPDRNRIIYDIDQFGIDEQIIQDKLDMAKNKYGYSNILCNFIQLCLNIRYEQRPDFLELKQCFTRKLHRKYQRQSQFLSQFAKFESTKGISYNIILPSSSKSSNQISNKNIIPQASAINISEFKLSLEQTLANKNQNEKKQIKIKKKPSSKFQKVKSNTKIKQQTKQTQQKQQKQLQKKIQQKQQQKEQKLYNYNIQYRGTFGDRHIITNKTEGQNNSKMIKKSKKQSLQDIDQQVNSYVKKYQVKQKQKVPKYQKIQQNIQLYKVQKNKNNLTISITHKQTNKGQQVETPKGFGQYSFQNSFTIEDYKKMFQNYIFDIQDLPKLITQMKYLKLQQCLLPIQDIIKNMQKVGVWVQGDLYYGDFLNGRRDGLGLELFLNGEYYFGYFKEDLFKDQGFYFWNQRQYFFGKFELGQKVWGRLEGEIKYQGGFKDNKRSGFGTCWYASGQIYTGKWFNGKKHGKGYLFQPDGSKFVGNWVKGKKKGQGQISTQTMTILGHWNQQIVEGQAQIRYSNGDIFIGKIGPIFEKIVGQYISKSGRKFIGEFQNDQPKKGQLKYSNGDRYVGQLKNMKRHGYGEYFYSSGEVYKGLWENNSKKQQK